MTQKRSRLTAVLRLAKHKEDTSTASHHLQLEKVEEARKMFISAQNRAMPGEPVGSVDDLQRQRDLKAASARTALAAKHELARQIERSIEERNHMLADMRHRRTVERIDDEHRKAWANLAAQAADRALDDIALVGWQRRNS